MVTDKSLITLSSLTTKYQSGTPHNYMSLQLPKKYNSVAPPKRRFCSSPKNLSLQFHKNIKFCRFLATIPQLPKIQICSPPPKKKQKQYCSSPIKSLQLPPKIQFRGSQKLQVCSSQINLILQLLPKNASLQLPPKTILQLLYYKSAATPKNTIQQLPRTASL